MCLAHHTTYPPNLRGLALHILRWLSSGWEFFLNWES